MSAGPTFKAQAFEAPRGAAPALAETHRRMNTRSVPPVLAAVEALSKQTQVYIFNVGPWQHIQHMGSLGRYIIPPCPEGKKYSDPLVIPGIVSELYPESEASMKRVDSDGYETALQILGIGAHMAPSNSLKRYGVSVSKQWPPTEAEIKEAWENLKSGELEALIREANSAAATGPQSMEQTINSRHFEAARLLKKSVGDCPWLVRSTSVAERVECKFCGEPMKANLAKCPNCKEIVNQKLYDELIAKK